jgi:glutamine cyclotransferase
MDFKKIIILIVFLSVSIAGVNALSLKQIGTLSHEETAYTQGLFYYRGVLYESIGLYGRSEFRKLDAATGKVLKKIKFNKRFFAEGACELGGWIFVLTWNEETCFVVNPTSLEIVAELPYEGEGWGLCSDGKVLIMSNGSSELSFRDPKNLKIIRRINVKYKGKQIDQLNELEYINGEIWANVYMTDYILRIDPKTGIVKEKMDFSNKISYALRGRDAEVMNGIAWNPQTGQLLLGGKLWKNFFKYTITP